MSNKAIFLDSDGVLNKAIVKDGKPVAPRSIAELEIYEDAQLSLKKLNAAGYLLICVTNKPEIERNLMTQADIDAIFDKICQDLILDDVFICYSENSQCYKPKPGLLLEAAKKYNIELVESYIIGDRWRDVGAGQNAGCKTVWIDRGYAENPPDPPADYTAHSLMEATEWILNN